MNGPQFAVILTFIGLAATSASSAPVNAGSCAQAVVQAAVDFALDCDTVTLPACPETTWSSAVLVDLTAKSINLQGAGQDSTIIGAGGNPTLEIKAAAGRSFSLSGIQFIHDVAGDNGIVSIKGESKSWRVHHLKFVTSGNAGRLIYTHGFTYGVVDHVIAAGNTSEFITVDGDDWASWLRPQYFGDANAVFVEDSTITWTNYFIGRPAVDIDRGGRAVFRHNTVTNSNVGGHGFDSGGVASALSIEAYNNTFTIEDSMGVWSFLGQMRGGTGAWHDNTWRLGAGVWYGTFGPSLQTYRAANPYWGSMCNGQQQARMCGNIDKNWNLLSGGSPLGCVTDTDCTSVGSSCKWKFCSVSKQSLCQADSDCPGGESCSGFIDGPAADGYPCREQAGFTTQMAPSPVYGWNNIYYATGFCSASVHNACQTAADCPSGESCNFGTGGNVGAFTPANPGAALIAAEAPVVQANRDFFNAPKPGYAPYRYPHLLAGDGAAPPPDTTAPSRPRSLALR